MSVPTISLRSVRTAARIGRTRAGGAFTALATLGVLLVTGTVAVSAADPAWSVVTSTSSATLNGVSCVSSSYCLAVGTYGSEKGNGSTMATVAVPSSTGQTATSLNGISCSSTTFCISVGRYFKGGEDVGLLDRWNGTKWALGTYVLGPDATLDLNSVSCKGTTFCMAVGFYTDEPTYPFSLMWNGSSWTSETVPSPSSTDDMTLNGVSCTNSSFCLAVGTVGDDQLMVKWNGSSWTLLDTTPNLFPAAIRCRSTSFCMAVGSASTAAMAEQWNGSTWSVVSAPNGGGTSYNNLTGVSCTGTTFCAAVGTATFSASESTFSDVWNGATWSAAPTVNPVTPSDWFNGISCTTATGGEFCLGVGATVNGSDVTHSLVEKY